MNLYVRVVAKQGAEPGVPGIVRRTLEALMPAILNDKPKTPGWPVKFEHTEPVEGVALLDLPAPVQARVLCSAQANAVARFASQQSRIGVEARWARQGPVIPVDGGEFTIATLPTGEIVTCNTSSRSSGANGPYQLPAGVKTSPAGSQNVSGRPGHLGWGWAAPDVAKVEIVLSDGQVVPAQVAGGAYAYYAPNSDFMARSTVRAYDAAGNQFG